MAGLFGKLNRKGNIVQFSSLYLPLLLFLITAFIYTFILVCHYCSFNFITSNPQIWTAFPHQTSVVNVDDNISNDNYNNNGNNNILQEKCETFWMWGQRLALVVVGKLGSLYHWDLTTTWEPLSSRHSCWTDWDMCLVGVSKNSWEGGENIEKRRKQA